jgi:hypothetical protein
LETVVLLQNEEQLESFIHKWQVAIVGFFNMTMEGNNARWKDAEVEGNPKLESILL